MRSIVLLAGFIFAWLLAATAFAECPQRSLRVAVIPKTSMTALLREYRPLLNRLSADVGLPVDMVSVSSYESVIDAIVSGGADIAWMGPASYIQAYLRDPNIEAFASLTINEGHFTPAGNHYSSLLLVRSNGPATIDALRGGSVALSDPVSTSGALIPSMTFPARVGLPLHKFFGTVIYSGTHDRSLDALLAGRVDAAFIASVRADAYLNSERMGRDALRVLWQSEPIYYDPYVFSGNLCAPLKEKIRRSMLSNHPDLRAFLQSQHASGIAPVSHARYERLLRLMQEGHNH
jgi:phosphonate transport system substrate-binding protein